MKKINFNTGWTVAPLDAPMEKTRVTIPHDAMLSESRSEFSAGGKNTGWYDAKDYVYEKDFTPDEALAGKVMILEFEGVYRKAEVWINGEQAAFRPYGYTNFYVDVTNLLHIGQENNIRVIARNADQPNSRWYSGTGIYRPVNLWVADTSYIPEGSLRITTTELEPATVQITLRTVGAGMVDVQILDGETVVATGSAKSLGKAELTSQIPDAKLWSPENPHLYTCRVTFGTDVAESTFGVRTLSWGKDGFCINGKRVIINGACIHHDNGLLGACCYEDAVWRKVRKLAAKQENEETECSAKV